MAWSFNPIRTPWISALLLLMLIWSVWFLDAPASIHVRAIPYTSAETQGKERLELTGMQRQSVSQMATDRTKTTVDSASPNHPPVLSLKPAETSAPIVPLNPAETHAPMSPPKPTETHSAIVPSKPKETSNDEASAKQIDSAKVPAEEDSAEEDEEEEEKEEEKEEEAENDEAGKSSKAKAPIDEDAASEDEDPNRPLILYAYSETANARANLKFFLAHGLHQSADFVFIINGKSDAPQLIPSRPNIRVIERPNDCYDLGAHAEVLIKDDLWKRYKRFILMNASIRGPFVPTWAGGCWSEMYLGKLTEEVKVRGLLSSVWCSRSIWRSTSSRTSHPRHHAPIPKSHYRIPQD